MANDLTKVLYARVSPGARAYVDRLAAEAGVSLGRTVDAILVAAEADGWKVFKDRGAWAGVLPEPAPGLANGTEGP